MEYKHNDYSPFKEFGEYCFAHDDLVLLAFSPI